jgi:hypothetical protein
LAGAFLLEGGVSGVEPGGAGSTGDSISRATLERMGRRKRSEEVIAMLTGPGLMPGPLFCIALEKKRPTDQAPPRFDVPGQPQKSSESSTVRDCIAELGGQRMWLDLLVACGSGLPAIVYGSVLFVNYLQ